ncbi:MAG: response regulator transcription factor [Pseudomonadota bacterium]|uniref:Response regulator consisting of a CheY-like receiver domain and a winged-helix DNA-binding domain containing protein n=2 Tax=Methylophaga TaxID=40222 RepID=F5SV31_9GAMM|nr:MULTISPECIES: response regulator transcription factor [Methylophaga]EGL56091.1 response regulator consisting of a CheY-like receiver domain and a winged-helix DNA-binding domain containing protein [Methylophaga aminisulfidivorans MP]MEC9412872.1 response regulator transcription factor [Pseudomonadota bacterium]WVI86066.1 response regulator transcription factor [Methylophaga thalassica]GLP98233.1 DNA-binding response regulator [Methylophaga thalassica]
MANVLIIDDDAELVELFQEYLQQEQFQVSASLTGKAGLEMALTGDYDLIILDMMLPDITGTEILLQIRQKSLIPVLMFTAKGDDIDRIIGLESGADDYVPKPCTPRELVARIRAILRRMDALMVDMQTQDIQIGPLQLSAQKRQVLWFDKPLDLTSTEFNLLETLVRKAGHVVSKDELSQRALGRPLVRFDRSIDVHMSSIRQKLGNQQDGQSYIQTIRGKGYQFIRD